MLAAAFALTLGFAAPAPVLAWDTAGLQAEIGALLERTRTFIEPYRLEAGAIEVTPEGQGFRVVLPDLAVDDPLEGRRFEIGTLSLLVDEPGPGLIGFDDVRLPERMRVTENGQEVGWIVLDLDRYSGVYSTALRDFLQLDFLAESFEIRVPKESLLIGAGRIAAWVATVAEHDGGVATGYQRQRQYGSIDDLLISSPESTVEIAAMTVDGAVDGLDLRLYETMVAVIDDIEKAGAAGDEQRLEALRQTLTEALKLAETMRAGLLITGLTADDELGRRVVALDSVGFAMDLDTPRGQQFGSATLTIAGSGLALDPASDPEVAPYIDLVPTAWNIPLKVDHLPLDALALSMADLIYASAGNALLMPEQVLDSLGEAVLQALGTAGSYLIVRDLFIEAPLARLDGKASLAFSPNVELGVVGNVALTVTGLDRVLLLAERLGDPDGKRMLSAVVLGMMGVGQAVALPDGRVGYRYSFGFAPDGTVQMNGFSFGDLMNNAIPQ